MNKKVLKTMITLVVVFLVALYVLKIFFPEQFVMAIENENFVKIGNFIDSKEWLSNFISGITTFIGMWMYLCAIKGKWILSIKETIILVIVIIATRFMYVYDYEIATAISTISMFLIPLMSKSNIKRLPIIYSVHYFSQLMSLKIRNLPLLLNNINSVIAICLTAECYLWLLLFYIYFNYKREN